MQCPLVDSNGKPILHPRYQYPASLWEGTYGESFLTTRLSWHLNLNFASSCLCLVSEKHDTTLTILRHQGAKKLAGKQEKSCHLNDAIWLIITKQGKSCHLNDAIWLIITLFTFLSFIPKILPTSACQCAKVAEKVETVNIFIQSKGIICAKWQNMRMEKKESSNKAYFYPSGIYAQKL